jgi:hypothetical protein
MKIHFPHPSSNPPFLRSALKHRCKPGFALIATISVMVLLVMIALAMLSLSTIELRASQNGRAQAEAQANARVALMIAIGELQRTMGPDQRISARAETMALHPQLGIAVGSNPAASNTPKSWWVGVSHSDPDKGIDPDMAIGPNNPSVVWLISGLDPAATAQTQITSAQPFKMPVTMYGDQSIDTAVFTGGEPIEAGLVDVTDASGKSTGAYAYLIDDNGMKAQLAASNPKVRNDLPPTGGGVLPGLYNISILQDMRGLAAAEIADYGKLGSINDLQLLGADISASKAKRLGYTTRSRGVLSDVRKGGLKKDLTIAFENDQVFTAVFGNSGSGFAEKYIVMDSEKFVQSSDLQANGYIHWEMFKDYYNTKKHIIRNGNNHHLDTFLISKTGLFSQRNTPFGRGQLGPHQIGNNNQTHWQHRQMPYGNYQAMTAPAKRDGSSSLTKYYKHSPVIPILSRMQQNAWLEKRPGPNGTSRIRTNSQLWVAQYNPYNIGLNIVGDGRNFGPRIIHYPQVKFTVEGVKVKNLDKFGNPTGSEFSISNRNGFSGKRQSSIPRQILLGAGRSHVSAFKDYGTVGRDNDEFLFDDKVKDLTVESIYTEYDLVSVTAPVKLTADFVLERESLIHGANSNSGNGNHEVAQTMWAPFAWDNVNNRPAKKIVKNGIGANELNENSMASFSFHLRTTREGSGSLRPLVDANIRALMCNTKWDSPLGVELLAGYSAENQGETDEQIPQMHTVDAPKGYTYWGAGDDPADGYDRVILFDIPREDLISLGQLQHAGVGRFSYEPTYIAGNSYANLRIPLDSWKASIRDTFSTEARGLRDYVIPGQFSIYDASYLVNEELWDSYIFTTIPQVADNYSNTSEDPTPSDTYFEAVLAGEKLLPNPRFLPYEPTGSTFNQSTLQMSSSSGSETGAFYHNAGHLLVDGAFNVNSTSVDAWEAFLSGTHKLPYQKMDANGLISGFSPVNKVKGVRFPRVKSVFGEGMETDSLDENFWVGFRDLKQDEVRALAVAIVDEVKKRGPFLTFGEFVNRKLEDGEFGERGALQAALDITVNEGLDNDFGEDATHAGIPKYSSQASGFPGQLLQGDILQALSPYMTVRSDTFTIRAYGESRNPSSNRVEARVWCEAVVQRSPDPVVEPGSTTGNLKELTKPSSKFGRTLRIVSFRWLSPYEI